MIILGGFMAKIGAHKIEASNLLKLKCKINNKLMFCLLDLGVTNSVMISQVTKWLGVKTKLVANPIIVHLAQGIVKPSFNVTIGLKLFCKGFQFLENFTPYDLDNFHVIVLNTFLDVYKVDIFHKGSKIKVHAKVDFKLINLNVQYNSALVEVGINLVALANEFELLSFLILIFLKVS